MRHWLKIGSVATGGLVVAASLAASLASLAWRRATANAGAEQRTRRRDVVAQQSVGQLVAQLDIAAVGEEIEFLVCPQL